MRFRIGHGFDMHPLVAGRPLKLAGVEIPSEKGLRGHSDADVAYHAVANALLGAIGAGDLGRLFPPGDPRYENADSGELLSQVVERVRGDGWEVGNVDVTIVAQAPKLSPHLDLQAENLSHRLKVPRSAVNVKASSPEGMGALGRVEGMAAWAVVLLERGEPT